MSHADEETHTRLFVLLEEHMLPGVDRPGMEMRPIWSWRYRSWICDHDRFYDWRISTWRLVSFWDKRKYVYQSVVGNVCLIGPELQAGVGQSVVESGREGIGCNRLCTPRRWSPGGHGDRLRP